MGADAGVVIYCSDGTLENCVISGSKILRDPEEDEHWFHPRAILRQGIAAPRSFHNFRPKHSDLDFVGPPVLILGKFHLPPWPMQRFAFSSHNQHPQRWPILTENLHLGENPMQLV